MNSAPNKIFHCAVNCVFHDVVGAEPVSWVARAISSHHFLASGAFAGVLLVLLGGVAKPLTAPIIRRMGRRRCDAVLVV